MIKKIIEYVKDCFTITKPDRYKDGYAYAVEHLIKYKQVNGVPVREYLENKIDEAETFSCKGEFERGMREAIINYEFN